VLITVKVETTNEEFLMPEIDKTVFKRGFVKYGYNSTWAYLRYAASVV
jgi:hypothetical protein